MNDTKKDEQEEDRDVKINKILDEVVKLIEPLQQVHQVYVMRLLDFPVETGPETHYDVEIDYAVGEINKLLRYLSKRQRTYTMAKLNHTMRHHFDKISIHQEIESNVSIIAKSIIMDIVSEIIDERKGKSHD